MPRIMCFDYGLRRIGIAVTDTSKTISFPLCTVNSLDIVKFIDEYLQKEKVDTFIVGDPIIYNSEVNIKDEINKFVNLLKMHYNDKKIILYNERYTSKIAQYCISLSNRKKSDRRNKNEIDMISASLILNSYLDSIKFKLN